MENFLGKVRKATNSLGKAPFDDEYTGAVIEKATRKVFEDYEKFKVEDEERESESSPL